MISQITQFKVCVNGLDCIFYFDSQCSVDTAKSAILECLKWIGQVEDAAKEAKANQEEKPQETPEAQVEEKPQEVENDQPTD